MPSSSTPKTIGLFMARASMQACRHETALVQRGVLPWLPVLPYRSFCNDENLSAAPHKVKDIEFQIFG